MRTRLYDFWLDKARSRRTTDQEGVDKVENIKADVKQKRFAARYRAQKVRLMNPAIPATGSGTGTQSKRAGLLRFLRPNRRRGTPDDTEMGEVTEKAQASETHHQAS